jgi:hypothetical protein
VNNSDPSGACWSYVDSSGSTQTVCTAVYVDMPDIDFDTMIEAQIGNAIAGAGAADSTSPAPICLICDVEQGLLADSGATSASIDSGSVTLDMSVDNFNNLAALAGVPGINGFVPLAGAGVGGVIAIDGATIEWSLVIGPAGPIIAVAGVTIAVGLDLWIKY